MPSQNSRDYLTRARNVINSFGEGPSFGSAYALIKIAEQQDETNHKLDRTATALERIATALEHSNQQFRAQQADEEPANKASDRHVALFAFGVPIGALVAALLAGLAQWLL